MSEFDDPILRDRLSRYAGTAPGDDAAYAGVQQRVRQVKRRRVAVWSGAAAVVIGVGVVGSLSGPDGTRVTVTPADESELSTSSSASSTSNTSSTSSTTSSTVEATTIVASTAPTTAMSTGSTIAGDGSGGSGGGPGPSGGTNPTTPAAAPTQPVAPAPQESSRSAVGGTLHVRLADGSLSIVAATPNPGFGLDVKDAAGSRVRVEFESADHRSRVTATVVNGAIFISVEEDSDSSTDVTVDDGGRDDGPTTSDARDDGGSGSDSGSGSGGGGGGGSGSGSDDD